MRTHTVIIRAIGVSHTQLAKMSFDEIFDLAAGVYFYFYNNSDMFEVIPGPRLILF